MESDGITNAYDGVSWHHSLASKGQDILLKLPLGERPDSRSSMGRFVQNIIQHDGRYGGDVAATLPADHRPFVTKSIAGRTAIAKSIDAAALKSNSKREVIN